MAEQKERVSRALKAAEEVPLTRTTIPTSIAERILPIDLYPLMVQPLAHSLSESSTKGFRQIEAEVSVGMLLDMAPSAIALIIALAGLAEKPAATAHVQEAEQDRPDGKPAGPGKFNYSRTFRKVLFRNLARSYWSSFGVAPDIADNINAPGPATDWVRHVLALAAKRREWITPVKSPKRGPIPSVVLADETERQRLIKEIEAVFRLKPSVKAKRLGEGWRHYFQKPRRQRRTRIAAT